MKTLFRLAALSALTSAAFAEVPPELVRYSSRSGSLPPEYAWSTSVTIYLDGQVALQHCRGYETEGPACTWSNSHTTPAAITAIVDAVNASGLAAKPARVDENPPVGGGSSSAQIFLDGQEVVLPPFVVRADADRVATVLQVIVAAVPATDAHFLTGE